MIDSECQELKRMLADRTRELSALERAAHVFGAATHPEQDIYRQLTQQAAELLDTEMCLILLYDAEQHILIGQAPGVGFSDAEISNYRISLDKAGLVPQDFESSIIRDAPNDALVRQLNLDESARKLGVQSVLTIGMWHEGKLLGAIQLCNKRNGADFDTDDARLLSIFGSQVAVAIQNTRLLHQAQRHGEEMASLYEMALALAEAVDLDEMLDRVLTQVRRVLNYDGCILTLATADGKALRVRAVDGKEAESILGIELTSDQGINAWIYREGKPTLIDDADTDPRRVHIEGRTEAVRAAVGVPLVTDSQSIGTIYAFRRQPNAFTEADLNFLSITATHVAAALERARLLDRARRRAKEMESISNIGAVMASSLDVDHILQTIYEQASHIMDTRGFFITLYDADRQELDFQLTYDQGERLEPFVRPLSDREGLTAQVVRTAQPLLIRDIEAERDELGVVPVVIGEPAQSWLGIPIMAKDQVLGVICAQSYEPYAFSSRQMRLLSAIANQAGISLQNAQLYEAVQEAHQTAADERDKLAHLHRVILKVQKTEERKEKLQVIANGIHQIGWGRVSVSLRDADLNATELVCAGFAPEDEAALRENLLPGSEWRKWFDKELERFRIGQCYYLPWNDPWVRNNVHGIPSHKPEPTAADTWHPQDLLYVPLYGQGDQIVGLIGLDDPHDDRRPTADSLHIIELFAQETALIIENTQLLADLRLVNTDLQEMVDAQAQLLQIVEDLSSPVVPIVDGVIVLPLVGYLDERRAEQILETLLSGVKEHKAQVVLLDVTGVPVVDTQVAEYLMDSVRASRLVGADAILVGIRPKVAESLVSLGVQLEDVVTRSDLQSGVQYALQLVSQRSLDGPETESSPS